MRQEAAELTIHGEIINPASQTRALPPPSSVSRVFGIPELLSMVFLFCIAKDDVDPEYYDDWYIDIMEHHQYPRLSGKEAPLLLTHVCRRWRQTALNTPRLWACMHIELTNAVWHVPWLKGQLSALRLWRKRSRPKPLSVILSVGPNSIRLLKDFESMGANPTRLFCLLDLVEELSKFSHRWENVSVSLPGPVTSKFHKHKGKHYPLLKAFKIKEVGKFQRRRGMDLSFRSAPKLEKLSIESRNRNDYVVAPDGISPRLRVLQLSHIMMRFTQRTEGCRVRVLVLNEVILSEASFTSFPSTFPLLEELSIMVPFEDTTTHNDVNGVDFVVLDKLSTLRLHLSTEDYFPLYLFTAPMLKHLTVKDDVSFDNDGEPTHPSRNFDDEILFLLRRSRAPVVSFHYLNDSQISDSITMMLDEMPDLVKLHIEDQTLPAAVLEALKSPLVCPRLTTIRNDCTLECGGGLTARCGYKSVLQLMKARCRKHGNGPGCIKEEGELVYITDLAFPLHDSCERKFSKNKIFREADVVWKNTKKTSAWDNGIVAPEEWVHPLVLDSGLTPILLTGGRGLLVIGCIQCKAYHQCKVSLFFLHTMVEDGGR